MEVNTLIFGRVANVGITEIDNEFEYTGTRHALWSARAVTTSACPPAAAVNSGVWCFLPKNEASQKSVANQVPVQMTAIAPRGLVCLLYRATVQRTVANLLHKVTVAN
jgi:hypothetical protein